MACNDCSCSANKANEAVCAYCDKANFNGGFNTQAVHVSRNKIEYEQIETKFCPNCGRNLEVG